jgi:hypothetical protein
MVPASERSKTVHDLDRSATVTGTGTNLPLLYHSIVVCIQNWPLALKLSVIINK